MNAKERKQLKRTKKLKERRRWQENNTFNIDCLDDQSKENINKLIADNTDKIKTRPNGSQYINVKIVEPDEAYFSESLYLIIETGVAMSAELEKLGYSNFVTGELKENEILRIANNDISVAVSREVDGSSLLYAMSVHGDITKDEETTIEQRLKNIFLDFSKRDSENANNCVKASANKTKFIRAV
jgi:hypothetical protein